jgi:hypothetical protein
MPGGMTTTATTNLTELFQETIQLIAPAENITQGSAYIHATHRAVFCSAVIVDGSATIPGFAVALHLVRLNPLAGTVE